MSILSRKRMRDLSRQRWQFITVLVTMSMGVMLFGASWDAYSNLDVSYRSTYERLAFADMTVTGPDNSFAGEARRIPGVTAVEERLQADVPMRIHGATFVGRLTSIPTHQQPTIDRVDVIGGRYLRPGDTSALAETHLAVTFGLRPGDSVEVLTARGWQPVPIAGVVVSPEYLWPARSAQQLFEGPRDFGVLFVPADVVAAVAGPSAIRQALVRYAPGADSAVVDLAVRRAADTANAASTVSRADQPSNRLLFLDVSGFSEMAVLFPMMFLLAAGLATYLLLTRLVYAQRSQIGTLRANGMRRGPIVAHYLGYGASLGLVGGVIGAALGVVFGWAITGEYTAELGIPDTIRQLRPLTPILGVLFGVAAGTLAAWLPARQAVRVEPAVAMRGAVPLALGHSSLLERILAPLVRVPVRWRAAVRGVWRNPRRTLSTIAGIVLALTLVLTSWGLVDTTQILLDRQFNGVEREDAVVVMKVPVQTDLLRRIRAVPGVASAEQVVGLEVTVRGPSGSYATQLMAFDPATEMHRFAAGGLPAGKVLAGASIGGKTGAVQGDVVTLSFPALKRSVRIPMGRPLDEPLGTLTYVSRPTLVNLLRTSGLSDPEGQLAAPDRSIVMTRFTPRADRAATLQALRDLEPVIVVTDSRALYETVLQYMGFFYVFVGIMLIFGATMALALIFTTVSVNLAERSSEIAGMRANGISRGMIARLFTLENMLIAVIGIVPGLLAGYLSAAAFMATYSSDLLSFRLQMRASTLVLSAAAMLAVTGLSLWPGLRGVAGLDLARVVRERSQ